MSKLHEKPKAENVPSLSLWELFVADFLWVAVWFVVLTLCMALAYAVLTHANHGDGIDTGRCADKYGYIPWSGSIKDSLYFSIATETTVGYGDLSPKGWSRGLACLQALLGLTIFGLILDKVTSLPKTGTRVLIGRCKGYWIEICETQPLQVSLITLRYEDGLVRYDGLNFDEHGNEQDDFVGHTQPANFLQCSEVLIPYSNRNAIDETKKNDHFYEGVTRLWFMNQNQSTGRYDFFKGTAEDHKYGRIHMVGYRASKEQESILRSKYDRKRRIAELVRDQVGKYLDDKRPK